MAFEPEEKYEQPDGSPIVMDTAFFGRSRGSQPLPGPFEQVKGERIAF